MPRSAVGLASVGPSVYLPSLLFGIGQGAIAPIIALTALELGASVATAGLVVAVAGLGRIVGDLPAGRLAIRVGERNAMMVALAVTVAALVGCILAASVVVLAVAVAVTGMAASVFGLARHAYLTEVMPYELRGRALSTLGGTQRIGLFVGPFLGAAITRWLGTDGGYWLHIVVALIAVVVLVVVPEPPVERADGALRPSSSESTFGTIRRHLPVLRTLGFGALLVGAVRASRQVAIPLWADGLGLDPAHTSLVFGISGAVEMLLFYPAGLVMDRFGRRWVVVPSMLILGASLVLMPLTQSAGALTAVAMLMGFGNGLGSGIIMTIGADVSPETSRITFLGAWRLLADIGNGAGPVMISAIAAVATLGLAIGSAGALAALAAFVMARWIPRHPGPSRG